MQKSLPQKVHEYIKEHLRHKRWRRVVTAMACVVVFCTTYALILPAITMTGETYCGLEEHTHSAEACYERVLVCGYDETGAAEESDSGHTHTDACYETRSNLVCNEEETAGHTHDESCYDEAGNLACGQEEAQGHSHSEDCYLEQSVLTCGQEETEATEPTSGHVHTDDCYEEKLVCQLEEHEHSLSCFSNPEADVESASVWERTLPKELGDNWAENVVAVAKSQLGYTESTANYTVLEDGVTMKGYTRYGAWYGMPYDDWCAMFASFCLNYAGVPQSAVPYGSGCIYWVEQLQDAGLYESAADCYPEPGFLVFFDTDGDGLADHVGIVAEVAEDGESIQTIEGNIGGAVVTRSYSASDSTILGYCILPENPDVQGDETASDDGIMPAAVLPDDVVDGGTFQSAEGNEMTWTLTVDAAGEYTLTIDGEGAMPDYSSSTLTDRPWAQYSSTSLHLVIGDAINRIGSGSFWNANLLTVKIGSAVSSIGANAFRSVLKLKEVDIPGTVDVIEQNAFAYAYGLGIITFHEGTKTIQDEAFTSAIEEVYIPASVTFIDGSAFWAVGRFIVAEDSSSFAADENGVLYTKGVDELVCFTNGSQVAVYRIPDTVSTIREGALKLVASIDKLIIPASVTSIPGGGALGYGSSYKEIYFENGSQIGTIGKYMFYNIPTLTTLHLPENTPLVLGSLGLSDTWPNLTSLEIPNGVTRIEENLAGSGSMLGLESLRYNAANATFGPQVNNICGTDAYFALTIGKDVDTLAEKFSYFVEHATSIAFEKNNQITITEGAFANAPAPLTGLSGTVYVDDQGVVYSYDASVGTAKVVYVPADVTSVIIPETIAPEEGVTVSVTAVGANALSLAEKLTSITFDAPSAITEIGIYGLGNCPTLTSVNGKTTVEEAKALFSRAAMGYGAFDNNGLTGSSGSGVDEDNMAGEESLIVSRTGATNMTISVSSAGETLAWQGNEDGTGGYTLLTGDTMTVTASVGNTQGRDNYVYRLYIKKGNTKCSLSITAGTTYTFDGNTAICYATEDPNVVYLEFTPSTGKTLSVPVTAVYPSPGSSGGGIAVWGEILTASEAADKSTIHSAGKQINAFWKTQPDEYTLSKTLNGGSSIAIAGSEDGVARPASSLGWNIRLDRSTDTTSAYGKDIVKSVDFSDTLTLPDGIHWSEAVLQAVRDGNVGSSNGYLYAGDVKIAYNSQTSKWSGWRVTLSEDGQNLVFHWKYNNSSRTAELGSSAGVIIVYPEALYADLDEFGSDSSGETLTNTANADVHYTYSADKELSASVDRSLALRQGTISLTKSANGGSYFGEDITYTVKLQNTGALVWTGTNDSYYVQDNLSLYSYISPENMKKMFEEEYGDLLTITISNANLGTWQAVTATDGETTSYRTSGNSNFGTDKQTLAITKSEDGYAVTVTGGGTYTGVTPAEALRNAGYAVTPNAQYQCKWTLDQGENEMLTIHGGQGYTFMVYATAKDTFGMLSADWPNQYPSEQKLTVLNTAGLYGVKNGKATRQTYANAQTQVKREAIISKSVYDEENRNLGKAPAASDGDVLSYQLDFTHYGSGEYNNLPMVDDLYGSQYLLVPVEQNPALANRGFATKQFGGESYYVLTEGSYENVVVGEDDEGNWLNAATITVTSTATEEETTGGSYTGVHTQIKWYFAHLDGGSYRKTIRYQAVVDMSTSGVSYTLGNTVWMNDRTSNRIYDSLWGGGTIIDFDKSIVEEKGNTPAQDVLNEEDYSAIAPGNTVTYRLHLRNSASTEDFTFTLNGANLVDMLPETYGVFDWTKNVNVSLSYVKDDAVTVTGLENWSIVTQDQTTLGLTGNRLCMAWPQETAIVFHGNCSLYLYVTLTFPTDTDGGSATWTDYAAANGGVQLDNTLYVYRFPDSVQHDLKETGSALLQKGVLGLARESNSNYYGTGSDRQHYANADAYNRSVFYYVALYNGSNKRLYLSDLQDKLPAGFTYENMLPANFDPAAASGEWYFTTQYSITSVGGNTSKLINAEDLADGAPIVFRSATITPKASEDKGSVVFAISSGSGEYALKYDSEREQYYLDRGEALVFGYAARVGTAGNTEDAAINTVAMPYTDHLSTGVSQISKDDVSVSAVTTARYADTNDGNRLVQSAYTVRQQYGFTGGGEASWLVSSVTLRRGSIVPGITKYTESYTNDGTTTAYTNSVMPSYTVNWRIRLQNTGTTAMTDYTFTDVMPSPYVFTGEVKYTIYDSSGRSLHSGSILSFNGTRTGGEDSVSVTNGWGGGTTTLPMDGTETWLNKNKNEVSAAMSRDTKGNECLTLHIQTLSRSIPEGGYMDVTFSSVNPTTNYNNQVYINQATLTPNQQSFTTAGQGSIVRDDSGKAVSVRNSSPVTVSYGYATSSEKRVTESANGNNTAVSTDAENNWILLPSSESEFRYTLTVNNDTEQAMSRLVLIDNLPEVDDHSPFNTDAQRDSEFAVNFAENPDVTVTITPENGTAFALDSQYYTVEYSTQTDFGEPQSADWKGEDTGKWTSSSANARSLRIVITDDGKTQIPAKSKVEVSFSAKVGADAEPGKIAWNSFGYHYALGNDIELEAMPLVVGVKIPSVPTLTKQLVDDLNQPVVAEEDETFRFLIYEGEALSGCDTEDALKAALDAAGRKYMETTVTVKAGASESGAVTLQTDKFQWTEGQKYTAVELTGETENYKLSGFVGGDKTITFTYHAASDTVLTCRNEQWQWKVELTKVDLTDGTKVLPGAVFALYSPNAADRIEIPAEYAELGIQAEIAVDDTMWYLCSVQTTGTDGTIFWEKLGQEKYYLLEVKAPDGYNLPKEPGQVLSRDSAAQGVCSVTVQNTPGYALPKTGGAGTLLFTIGGTLLLAGSLLSGYVLRRKRERRFMR